MEQRRAFAAGQCRSVVQQRELAELSPAAEAVVVVAPALIAVAAASPRKYRASIEVAASVSPVLAERPYRRSMQIQRSAAFLEAEFVVGQPEGLVVDPQKARTNSVDHLV